MPSSRADLSVLAAAATAAGALVHAAAAGSHAADPAVAWVFAATAAVQLAVAAAVWHRPTRRWLAVTAALGVAVAGAWVVSRTVGLPAPFPAGLQGVEAVGVQDGWAAALGLVAAVAAVLAFARPGLRLLPAVSAVLVVPALLAMAAPHAHGDSSEAHDHGTAAVATDHEHESDDDATGEVTEAATDHDHTETGAETAGTAVAPMFAGADTTGVTDEQLEAATDLLVSTRAVVTPAYPDEGALVAAGYVSIGDGRRPGGYEHFVHHGYLVDDHVLDPEHVESVVTQDGVVVSAMYLLPPGSTMADVPDIAGPLTTWHDHQNLCWDESGQRLAGVVVGGRCRPGGTQRSTAPMLHVWLTDNPCGPFAGIEGHGAGEGGCASHEH